MGALDFALLWGVAVSGNGSRVCIRNSRSCGQLVNRPMQRMMANSAPNSPGIDKQGAKVQHTGKTGSGISRTTCPIVKPEDMKGIKFRSAESIRLDMFKQLGASAVPMPFTELFTALQQGTVDGRENPLSIIQRLDSMRFKVYVAVRTYMECSSDGSYRRPDV